MSTYASILSICLCDSTDAYSLIERDRLYDWLFSLKNPDGSFRVNNEGESDARSVYAAVCVSSLVGISMDDPLFEGTLQWLCKCQTYEEVFQVSLTPRLMADIHFVPLPQLLCWEVLTI